MIFCSILTSLKIITDEFNLKNNIFMGIVSILTAARSVINVATPYTMAVLAQAVAEDNDDIDVFGVTRVTQHTLLWSYVVLQIGDFVFAHTNKFITARLRMIFMGRLIEKTLKHMTELSQQQLENLEKDMGLSSNMKRIFEDGDSILSTFIADFIPSVLEVTIANILIFWKIGSIEGLAALILSASILLDHRIASYSNNAAGQYVEKLYGSYAQTVKAMKTVRVSGSGELQNRMIRDTWGYFKESQLKTSNTIILVSCFKSCVTIIALSLYIYATVGDKKIDKNEIDNLVFLLGYAVRLTGLVASIDAAFIGLQSRAESFNKFRLFFNMLPELAHIAITDAQLQNAQLLIEFDDCHFRYPGKDREVLNGVTFAIPRDPAANYMALVGRSGSGKTTVLELILGFCNAATPQSVRAFGVHLSQIDRRKFYPNIGWVPQYPEIFVGSFRQNILLNHFGTQCAAIGPNVHNAHERYNVIYQQMKNPLIEEAIFEDAAIKAQLYDKLKDYYILLAGLYVQKFVIEPANKIYGHFSALSQVQFVTPETWAAWQALGAPSPAYSQFVQEIYKEYRANSVGESGNYLALKYLIVPVCIIDPRDTAGRAQQHQWQVLIFSFDRATLGFDPQSQIQGSVFLAMQDDEPGVVILGLNERETRINIPIPSADGNAVLPLHLHHSFRNRNISTPIDTAVLPNNHEYNYDFLRMLISLHNFIYRELNVYYNERQESCCSRRIRKSIAAFGQYIASVDPVNHVNDSLELIEKFVVETDLFALDMPPVSGGEKQRIGAARVFAQQDLKLLLLDEPTSAMDAFTEAAVVEQYRQKMRGTAALIISHRLSSVRDANSIMWMQEGQINADQCGTHDGLLTRDTHYHRAWNLQMGRR